MGYADKFDEAAPLESIAWIYMSDKARVQKLAYLYRKDERSIRYAHRNYCGPTLGTVKAFVRSLYTPPRGKMGSTFKDVLDAIKAQKEKETDRKKYAPFVWSKPSVADRMKWVIRRRLRVFTKSYNGEKEKVSIKCSAVSTVSGVLLLVEPGGYYHHPRIYMKDKRTKKVKVVVMGERNIKSLSDALLALSPNGVVRQIFGGASVALDFENEGFNIDGELVRWSNTCKVYHGTKQALNTMAKP